MPRICVCIDLKGNMDPDDQHDVARGDEAIDQGLAYQLEQCRYALLQRDEQLRKALAEVADYKHDCAQMTKQIIQRGRELQEAVELLRPASAPEMYHNKEAEMWARRRDSFMARQKGAA